ncbi:MAG: hypothetical protein ACLR7D_06405 [Lachnospira eligens]
MKATGINVVYADAGDSIKSGEFSVECMHPCKGYNYESANDYSRCISCGIWRFFYAYDR